jgi:DHA2 family multidrug resistance protein-like MFS transporter
MANDWEVTMSQQQNSNAAQPRAGRREWVGLVVLALACVLYAMDLTVLHLAVPRLSADLGPSSSQLLWIIDIYGFLVAGSLITMGTLGDRIGRRKLLLIGAGAFGVASIFAAFSTSAGMLIAARALLGIAGATLAPSTLSLIRNMFLDDHQRTVAIGVWITSFSVGGAIGPLFGGLMLEFFWWGSVFLLAVPVMGVLLILGPSLLPEFKDPDAGRLDILSAAMSLVAVLGVIYGLKQIAEHGFGPSATVPMLAGLAVGLAFVHRQNRQENPLIDLKLFKRPAFSGSLATFSLAIFAMFGSFMFIAQYLQLVLGLTPLQAGLWTLPQSVGFVAGSMFAPQIVRRVRPALVMGGGLLLAATGLAMLTQIQAGSGLPILVTASIVMSLGLAPVFTLGTDLIIGSAPPERAGAASGISETSAEFGGALGIAVLGSIGVAVYRSDVTDAVPAEIPAPAAEAARDTLGGAVSVAGQLPEQLGGALVDAAQVAFTNGLHLTAAIGAVISVGIAALATHLLRNARPGGGVEEQAPEAQAPDETAVDPVLQPVAAEA